MVGRKVKLHMQTSILKSNLLRMHMKQSAHASSADLPVVYSVMFCQCDTVIAYKQIINKQFLCTYNNGMFGMYYLCCGSYIVVFSYCI